MTRASELSSEILSAEGTNPMPSDNGQGQDGTPQGIEILSAAALVKRYPTLRPPLLPGLLRRGETANIVGAPKMSKSWNVLHLAIAFATGSEWLGYRAVQSQVLVIDNELHRETLSYRLSKVCKALGQNVADLRGKLDFMPLRGRLSDIYKIVERLIKLEERGRYDVIVLDALYRALPAGCDENSNADIAKIYNAIDGLSAELDCAVIIIHHSSKGTQTRKTVTDVGSGAGSMSRAADTHIILRSHETAGVLVMEAACRSWAPVKPRCLKLDFPLWIPADEHDPGKLQTARTSTAGATEVQVKAFVERFVATVSRPKAQIEIDAHKAGHSQKTTRELLKLAEDLGFIYRHMPGGPKKPHHFATVPPASSASDTKSDTEPEAES